jgi:uncharacterized protein (TIGR03435 family)
MADVMAIARAMGANVGAAGSAGDTASEPSGNSIFASIQALGLKLEPRKGSIDTLIIDHIEKNPTEN